MVILNKYEQIVVEEPVKMIHNGVTQSGGNLVLTNQRIIYEMKKGGFLGGGGMETVLDEKLGGVYNVTDSKPFIPIPLISKKVVRVEFSGKKSYEFAVRDSTYWRGVIVNTLNDFKYRLEKDEEEEMKRKKEEKRRERKKIEEREKREKEEKDRKEREEKEYQYRLQVDRERAKAEGAASIAKAGASSTSIQVGQIGNAKTDVRDSVLQRSKIGGGGPEPDVEWDSNKTCPNCNAEVQPGWKACPACGGQIPAACPHCGASIQPKWKACPACGNSL